VPRRRMERWLVSQFALLFHWLSACGGTHVEALIFETELVEEEMSVYLAGRGLAG
jgi:hypothetical protein